MGNTKILDSRNGLIGPNATDEYLILRQETEHGVLFEVWERTTMEVYRFWSPFLRTEYNYTIYPSQL